MHSLSSQRSNTNTSDVGSAVLQQQQQQPTNEKFALLMRTFLIMKFENSIWRTDK